MGSGGHFGLKVGPGSGWTPKTDSRRDPFAPQVGNPNRPKLGQCAIPHITFSIFCLDRFRSPLGTDFRRILRTKTNRNLSKIDFKNDYGTKTRSLDFTHKRQCFPTLVGSPGGPKLIKIRFRNDLKLRCPNSTQ